MTDYCRLCDFNNRRPVECRCTLCEIMSCSGHRTLYSDDLIACSNCYDDIHRGRRALSDDLRTLIETKDAEWKRRLNEWQAAAWALFQRWHDDEGLTWEQCSQQFWGTTSGKQHS